MKITLYPDRSDWAELLKRPKIDVSELHEMVNDVLEQIKNEGDAALKRFTKQFDGVSLDSLFVTEQEINEACMMVSNQLKDAIYKAKLNIEKFHESQKLVVNKIETQPGVFCWQKSVGIEKVGIYVPGGTAPLFSTVLMLAIPARIAGCKEVVMCTPPDKNGKINPSILYAASMVGVTIIFKLGGVQAVGAMAYGTESVPKVYKIFGPGNRFVTAAKQLVSLKDVAIDMPAGPSEVLVMADVSADASFVASDLLSQAEHGADSQVVFVTDSKDMLDDVVSEVTAQVDLLTRKETAVKALANSRAILLNNIDEMIELSNQYAPEHLIISVKDAEHVSAGVVNAGSVFLGNYTPESAGDYASGTNHTLPTHGYATAYSGVNLDSFIRKITFQEITPEGLKNLGPIIERMAKAEMLDAHKNAVTLRLKKINV
ncbi:MAG: histidinol dehydrogenase [Marinilabiliaceae bacterium]|nr:histidinol dehydrogenase [Marinilabiliaceae bacterium]